MILCSLANTDNQIFPQTQNIALNYINVIVRRIEGTFALSLGESEEKAMETKNEGWVGNIACSFPLLRS